MGLRDNNPAYERWTLVNTAVEEILTDPYLHFLTR